LQTTSKQDDYVGLITCSVWKTDPRWNKSMLKNLKSSTWNSSTACSSDIAALYTDHTHTVYTTDHPHTCNACLLCTSTLTLSVPKYALLIWMNWNSDISVLALISWHCHLTLQTMYFFLHLRGPSNNFNI